MTPNKTDSIWSTHVWPWNTFYSGSIGCWAVIRTICNPFAIYTRVLFLSQNISTSSLSSIYRYYSVYQILYILYPIFTSCHTRPVIFFCRVNYLARKTNAKVRYYIKHKVWKLTDNLNLPVINYDVLKIDWNFYFLLNFVCSYGIIHRDL